MSVNRCSSFSVSRRKSGMAANAVVNDKGIGYPPDALDLAANHDTVTGS